LIGISLKSQPEKTGNSIKVISERHTKKSLNVAIIGGGKACHDLIKLLDKDRLSRLNMKIIGVCDINTEAPGFRYAKKLDIFTTTNLEELLGLEELNLVIELTGSAKARTEILVKKPSGVSVIDYRSARLLWDLIQIETEKTELEKQHEQYQERSKKHIQVILDSLPYRIMVFNMDMTIDTVNQTFLKESNLTHEDIVGKHCYEVRYGLDRPCKETDGFCFLEDQLKEIKDKGFVSTYKEYVDENGDSRFDVIIAAPIFNEHGEIAQLLEASRDMTERLKLQQEVQKSKTFFENVIQSTVDGIVVVDTKGNVLIFNEGMEQLTGLTANEIMEKGHLSSFYDIDLAKENMKKMRSDEHGPPGKLNPTSMNITTKDGEEVPITLSASIITINGKETGSVGIFTDMREVLKMRKDLEETHLKLIESERIATIGKMGAGVAHEVNNPLSGILIYAELLKGALKDNTQHLNDVQEIIDQTLRCKKIVSELLEFSRQSIGKVTSFSVEDLINKSLNLLINQAMFHDITVNKEIKPNLPHIEGDMGQLQQVLNNLFINAADAMEGKGALDIKAEYNPRDSLFTIMVSDTGPGIPKELRNDVFDIFFTTKPVGKGTGLGLNISQNIIKLHGGDLTFECPPEGGTTFFIKLPLEVTEQSFEEPVFIGMDES